MAIDGQGWGWHSDADRELDDADDEPMLGWPESGDGPQRKAAPGLHDDQDVPTGFRRVRRALADEREATDEANRKLRRIIDRLTGSPVGGGQIGNLAPVTITIIGPDGHLHRAAPL